MRDGLSYKGKVEIFVTRGKPLIRPEGLILCSRGKNVYKSCSIGFLPGQLISQDTVYNIVVNKGKDKAVTALVTGNVHQIGRMAIGDRGALPSDLSQTKIPVPTMSELYNEIYRADIDTYVLDVGTDLVHEAKFIKTFSATDVPITSFSNQAQPIINEVGLITFDELAAAGPLPRIPVAAPNPPPPDEELFSIRTFKSVPFEAANEISVTIRYTIFIE